MKHVDNIVIGQGIAGTTLAWQLIAQDANVLVIDRNAPVTSSKIAAGLMTPISGQNLKPAWKWETLWPFARDFYRDIETKTDSQFFHETPTVRIYAHAHEPAATIRRNANRKVQMTEPQPPLDPEQFVAPFGAFSMSPAGRVNVPEFLTASRDFFSANNSFLESDVDVSHELQFQDDRIEISRLGVSADRITLCQGFAASDNLVFRQLQFDAAQGEILTVRIDGLKEERVIRHGIWLAPLGNGLFKVGSTYDRHQLDGTPTAERRLELCEKLQEFLRLPVEVVKHEAAVRPNLVGRYPVIGRHVDHPGLTVFNGLGSKGTLMAPYAAYQLVNLLINDTSPDQEIDLQHRFKPRHFRERLARPLTQLAHDLVAEHVSKGDVAIDATSGNGYDSRFLANCVGPTGKVYGFDIQPEAIERTQTRLDAAKISNVTLLQKSHENIAHPLDAADRERVSAVMFNLGYLPGGNKTITTLPTSTRHAITNAAHLIQPGGVISILVYIGHDGGREEAEVVVEVLDELSQQDNFEVTRYKAPVERPVAPILYLLRKQGNV